MLETTIPFAQLAVYNKHFTQGIDWRVLLPLQTTPAKITRNLDVVRVLLYQLTPQFDFTKQQTECLHWSPTLTSLYRSAHPSSIHIYEPTET